MTRNKCGMTKGRTVISALGFLVILRLDRRISYIISELTTLPLSGLKFCVIAVLGTAIFPTDYRVKPDNDTKI